jgi:type IV pilus assembly protein PilN
MRSGDEEFRLMARINLLPWRAERRKQREREFYMMLAASAVAAVLVFLVASYWMSQRIENQNDRNKYLTDQIKLLDKDIETIKDLEKVRSQLLARKEIIEDLQSNRSQMVHLFDQLSKTIPEGTRLTSMKQAGEKLTLEGLAESSTRVATYMSNLDKSPYLGRSDLAKIESKEGTAGADSKMPYVFSLSVKTKKAAEDDEKLAADGAAPAAASAPNGGPAGASGPDVNPGSTTGKPSEPPAAVQPASSEEKKP